MVAKAYHINSNLYHYAGNNPVKYTDPTGMWIDNEDGTYTAEEGDTLYGLYGDDWQKYSNFNRDPCTLQIGETVGNKESVDDIPIAPSFVDIDANIETAKSMNVIEFYNAVRNNGDWIINNMERHMKNLGILILE